MKRQRLFLIVTAILAVASLLAACSGGGGGGGSTTTTSQTQALTVADRVSVVDPQLSSTALSVKPLLMGLFRVTAADLAGTDYGSDKTQIWVSERSAESFNIVNEILCMISQTKYDVMLNQGDYIALVDQKMCSSMNADASNAGNESQNQSSSATMPNYMSWTVNSSRADNSSPQIVKAWIHEKAQPEHQSRKKSSTQRSPSPRAKALRIPMACSK